jgi:hypothetical protein
MSMKWLKQIVKKAPLIRRLLEQKDRALAKLHRIKVRLQLSPIERRHLPDFAKIPDTLRKNRNIREGYSRGWGIQFGDLREKIRRDPLYLEATDLASGRTIVAEDIRMNLFLILKFFLTKLPRGHIVEFGSYKGGNAIFMASVARKLYPGMRVYSLDTFTGMPETDDAVDAHSTGDFSDTDLQELIAFTRQSGLDNLEFCKGLFQDVAPGLLPKVRDVVLAYIDCDIYSAVGYSYEIVKPYMVQGGYILFDDAAIASCLGATEAVEDLLIRRDGLNCEQIAPNYVFRAFFK